MVCLPSFVRVKVLSVFLTEPYLYLGKRYPSLFWKSVKLILAQQDHKSLRRGWKSEDTAQVYLPIYPNVQQSCVKQCTFCKGDIFNPIFFLVWF